LSPSAPYLIHERFTRKLVSKIVYDLNSWAATVGLHYNQRIIETKFEDPRN